MSQGISLFDLNKPVERSFSGLNLNNFDEVEVWAAYKNISTIFEETTLGKAIGFNDKVFLLPNPKGKSSDQLRTLQKDFKNAGKSLYYTYEWEVDTHKLLSHFESKLGLDTVKYAAKRMVIEEIPKVEADAFMREFHIQGSAAGVDKVSIALKDKKTGVTQAVQQFCKYRFGVTKGQKINESKVWEGLRLCFRPGVQIHGGASRLQKYFEKEYQPEKVLSYISLSHSSGVYKASQGFRDITDWNQLSYMWVLDKTPIIVPIVDKNGVKRYNNLDDCYANKYISPNKVAGSFGKGVGQTLYGGKLGSRKQLREHSENGELVHNDVILEAIGYVKHYTSGQAKWVKEL